MFLIKYNARCSEYWEMGKVHVNCKYFSSLSNPSPRKEFREWPASSVCEEDGNNWTFQGGGTFPPSCGPLLSRSTLTTLPLVRGASLFWFSYLYNTFRIMNVFFTTGSSHWHTSRTGGQTNKWVLGKCALISCHTHKRKNWRNKLSHLLRMLTTKLEAWGLWLLLQLLSAVKYYLV